LGKKGGKKHLKRKPAPRLWPIHRKEAVWTVKPKPGPHPISSCIPLALLVRDILGFAKTRKEAKTIISKERLKVDGKAQREELFAIGLMDVVSIPDITKDYRVLPSKKGPTLHPIEKDEAEFKLCRIENKTVTKSGHIQLNLHDGTNVLIPVKDPKKPEEDVYKTLDVLKLGIPNRELLDHVGLKVGDAAMIIEGKNVGKYGEITDIEERLGQKRRELLVTIKDKNGNILKTILNYVFIVGDAEPYISLPEAD
jgi:small subunit ribosomal protein S4e